MYFVTGAGLLSINSMIANSIATHARLHGHPIIIGGDFNYPPCAVGGLFQACDLRLDVCATAPHDPTCVTFKNATRIDYFLVSPTISCLRSGEEAQAVDGFMHAPHVQAHSLD